MQNPAEVIQKANLMWYRKWWVSKSKI